MAMLIRITIADDGGRWSGQSRWLQILVKLIANMAMLILLIILVTMVILTKATTGMIFLISLIILVTSRECTQ